MLQDDLVMYELLLPPFHECYDLFLPHVILKDAFFHVLFFLLFVFFLLGMNFDLNKKNRKKKKEKRIYESKKDVKRRE